MKVLIVHNSYKIKGGEDTVVQNEISLLEKNGIEVVTYFKNNHEIDNYGTLSKLALLTKTSYSEDSFKSISAFLEKEQPDICHVHNYFPIITPAVFYACKAKNIPVVQTLHNYRLTCINGMFIRDGKPCEDCLTKKSLYPGLKNRCYRNSYVQSYAATRMLSTNNSKGTWNNVVDKYLCLTQFAKDKFVQAGIETNLLEVKPNFISVQLNLEKIKKTHPSQILFIGRLETAKGIHSYIDLAKNNPDINFVAAGKNVENFDFENSNIQYVGELSYDEAQKLIAESTALVFPSKWYEGMPMTIIEAFALKTPVIASNLGAMSSMIDHEVNGLLFDPDDVQDLTLKLKALLSNKELMDNITIEAHNSYYNLYEPQANYDQLMSVYKSVLK